MRIAAMLEQKNSLPSAELHPPIDNRHSFACAGERHADVRWHVIGTFVVMLEVLILRDEFVEESFQVAACRGRGVLHRNQTATGVLHKNSNNTFAHFALVDLALNFIGNLVGPLTSRPHFKLFLVDMHKSYRLSEKAFAS